MCSGLKKKNNEKKENKANTSYSGSTRCGWEHLGRFREVIKSLHGEEQPGGGESACTPSSLLVKWFSPIFPPKPAGFGQSQHRGGCVPGTDSLLCICLAEHDLCCSVTSVCYLLLSSVSRDHVSALTSRGSLCCSRDCKL